MDFEFRACFVFRISCFGFIKLYGSMKDSTNTIFAILIALMSVCVLILLFLFGEWTYLNLLNVLLIAVITCAGATLRNRKGWYAITSGAAIVSFNYFISYCRTGEGYLGYIYAIAFAMNMFAFSYFLSPRFQARYGSPRCNLLRSSPF